MVIMVCKYKLKTGKAVEVLAQKIKESGLEQLYRKQPGNVCFNFGIPINDTDYIFLTDVWKSEQDFEAHRHCEATPTWTALKEEFVDHVEFLRYDV